MPLLETSYEIETPEGVQLRLHPAGPVSRLLAWLVDLVVRIVMFIAALLAIEPFGEVGSGLMFVLYFGIDWLYFVLFETLWHGRTPGKAALGLAVVRDDGQPVDWGASFIRNTMRAADFMPGMYIAGLASMVCTRRFQRLGDLTAGTIVVYERQGGVGPRTNSKTVQGLWNAQPQPPAHTLTATEQGALVALLARSSALGDGRTGEIAELVAEPLTGQAGNVHGVLACAAWVSGKR